MSKKPNGNRVITIPTPEEFLNKISLYKEFDFSNVGNNELRRMIDFRGPVDLFCVECNKMSTFKRELPPGVKFGTTEIMFAQVPNENVPVTIPERFEISLVCSRNSLHKVLFLFFCRSKQIQKIGQYPSFADLGKNNSLRYRSILGNFYNEYTKANGLHSHGIGIGSFVYLRRIFEMLIEDAHNQAKKNVDWHEERFINTRMDEKIKLLKDFLPDILVENSSIYSILSKGIHSLSEGECLDYYNVLRDGIDLILDEKIEMITNGNKKQSFRAAISEIKTRIK
jgi:hypothetical protein